MLDYRIETFLALCHTMSYRKTAELLSMTQPAVTQHMQALEREYGVKLFVYKSRILSKTPECEKLEELARATFYNCNSLKDSFKSSNKNTINFGVTKTIGDYILPSSVAKLLKNDYYKINIHVDNTQNLLKKLENFEIDICLIEGAFDKLKYDYLTHSNHNLVGICSQEHQFAGKAIELTDLLNETLLVREDGSGTRWVFDNYLKSMSHNYSSFANIGMLNSFKLITSAVAGGAGVSFVYDIVATNPALATFTLKDFQLTHEFNFCYLKNSHAKKYINYLNI